MGGDLNIDIQELSESCELWWGELTGDIHTGGYTRQNCQNHVSYCGGGRLSGYKQEYIQVMSESCELWWGNSLGIYTGEDIQLSESCEL